MTFNPYGTNVIQFQRHLIIVRFSKNSGFLSRYFFVLRAIPALRNRENTMELWLKKLVKKMKAVRLQKQEKERMWRHLQRYMNHGKRNKKS